MAASMAAMIANAITNVEASPGVPNDAVSGSIKSLRVSNAYDRLAQEEG
jgi:hypothetical protein